MCNRPTVSVSKRWTGTLAGALVVALAACFAAPTAVIAGPRTLDDAEFIRGLKNRGMKDLIVYYLEKNPPKDPIKKIEVLIEQKKLILEDETEQPDARKQAGMEVIDHYRELIKTAKPTDWKQIVWKVDYVTYLFEVVLPRLELNAAEFVEFGVPTKQQAASFEEFAGEAYRMMEDAGDQWFMMPMLLPKKPNFEEDFVNTGIWSMLKDDYAVIRLPFYRAWARYYYSMTDKGMKRPPKATRSELMEATRFLDAVARQGIAGSVKTKLWSVKGRIELANGDHVSADKTLNSAIAARTNGTSQMDVLVCQLAKVKTIAAPGLAAMDATKEGDKKQGNKKPGSKANAGKNNKKNAGKKGPEGDKGNAGETGEAAGDEKDKEKKKPVKAPLPPEVAKALGTLKSLKKLPLVKGSPMLLVLAYDLQFRLTKDYDAYIDLFNDPSLKGRPQIASAIENHVYSRFADMKIDDLSTAPPLVAMAHIDFNMIAPGRELSMRADKAEGKERERLIAEANKLLVPAVQELNNLAAREITESMRGKVLFKLGTTEYLRRNFFQAADALHTLADELPKDANAAASMKYASDLIMMVYKDFPEKDFVKEKVEAVLKTLLEKYPDLPEAKKYQYTWAAMLRQTKDYEKAIEAYNKIEPTHQFFADAQYEKLVCMHALWYNEPSDSDQKPKLAGAVPVEANKVIDITERALQQGGDANRKKKLKRNLGDALLIKCEVLAEGLGRPAEAQNLLKSFDAEYAEYRGLINQKRRLNINMLIRAGQAKDAVAELEKLIRQFPEEGGPLVRSVLESINNMAEDRIRLGDNAGAKELFAIGVDIAKFLLEWAQRQDEYKDPARQVPFKLILTNQYIAAGQFEPAMNMLEEMFKSNPKNMDIMLGLAKAYYAQDIFEAKDPGNPLSGALPITNKIINNTRPAAGSSKYPDSYWDVWALRLQALDKKYEAMKAENAQMAKDKGFADIHMNVRKLELNDKDLGGGPAQETLTRLKIKWAK